MLFSFWLMQNPSLQALFTVAWSSDPQLWIALRIIDYLLSWRVMVNTMSHEVDFT